MNFKLQNGFSISDITSADKPTYIEHFQEKQIYNQTLNIPYPYTTADAEWWVNHVTEETKKQGRSVKWAIRRQDGFLVGGVGFDLFELGKSYKAEIGYWLAKDYWGQGIMTEVVSQMTHFAFSEFGLVKVTANIFSFNVGSARVLEKAGFQLEGILRHHYKKDGKFFDGKLYAKIKEGFAG